MTCGLSKINTSSKDLLLFFLWKITLSYNSINFIIFRLVGESELSGKVDKDNARGTSDVIKLVTNNFIGKADQLFVTKSKEILG